MIHRMIDSDPMNKERLTHEAKRMAGKLSIPEDTAKAIILLGLYQTHRDEEGRLMADPSDIDDAILDGDNVQTD